MAWILIVLSAAFLLLAFFLWRRNQKPHAKLRLAEAKLMKLAKSSSTKAEQRALLKTLFLLIAQSPATDETIGYKAIDLLQLAYGQGLARPDEPVSLTGLIGSLLNQNRPEMAAAVLDTYRGLLRGLSSGQAAAEQLQTVGVMAMKAKHSFVAAKAVDIMFTVFERPERTADSEAVTAIIGALRVIGKLAIKREDHEFFRELVFRLRGFLAGTPQPAVSPAALVSLLSLWMHVIVSKQDETALTLLIDNVQELADRKLIDKPVIRGLLIEWQDLAGIASLNPNSQIAAIIIHDMVVLAEKTQDAALWSEMANAVSKVVRLIIEQYGTSYAFPLIYPMLDECRKMLAAQIRFPLETSVGDFRQKAICTVLKESLSVAEFAARARITGTTYDVIEELYHYWRDDQGLNYKIKSAKKFFQLMILYWHKQLGRQAKKQMPPQAELMEPCLFSQSELERLSFMSD